MTTKLQVRERRILLPGEIDDDEIASVISGLNQLDAVINIMQKGHELVVRYEFPAVSFGTIWRKIISNITHTRFGIGAWGVYTLLAWMEDNEYEHRHQQYGWEKYIQDIYVMDFYKQRTGSESQKRRLWQQYEIKGKLALKSATGHIPDHE